MIEHQILPRFPVNHTPHPKDPLERGSMINLNDIPYRHTAFLLHPPSPLIGEMGGSAKLVFDRRLRRVWVIVLLAMQVFVQTRLRLLSPTSLGGYCFAQIGCLGLYPNSSPTGVSDEFGCLGLYPNSSQTVSSTSLGLFCWLSWAW